MLTDAQIRQAKPRDRDYKLSDYDHLFLLIRPHGATLASGLPL